MSKDFSEQSSSPPPSMSKHEEVAKVESDSLLLAEGFNQSSSLLCTYQSSEEQLYGPSKPSNFIFHYTHLFIIYTHYHRTHFLLLARSPSISYLIILYPTHLSNTHFSHYSHSHANTLPLISPFLILVTHNLPLTISPPSCNTYQSISPITQFTKDTHIFQAHHAHISHHVASIRSSWKLQLLVLM